MTLDGRLDALDELWSVWAAVGGGLTGEDWQRPTRLDGWDLRALWAHAAGWPFGFSMLVGRETEEKITHPTAADLLREFNAPAGIATTARDQVARAGRDDAAKYTTEQLLGQFSGVGPEAIAVARELGPVTVDYFGRAVLPLAEAVSIGVVEATVHLLDVLRALGRAPDVPEAGLALTAEVIARIAPAVEFIEAATGRATTDLFPVMS